jgi:hypothetical protein
MMNKIRRKIRKAIKDALDSEYHRNPEHRTSSALRPIIPTFRRPLPNGSAKLDRKQKGHAWSKSRKTINGAKVLTYFNWGQKTHDQYKALPPRMFNQL